MRTASQQRFCEQGDGDGSDEGGEVGGPGRPSTADWVTGAIWDVDGGVMAGRN